MSVRDLSQVLRPVNQQSHLSESSTMDMPDYVFIRSLMFRTIAFVTYRINSNAGLGSISQIGSATLLLYNISVI